MNIKMFSIVYVTLILFMNSLYTGLEIYKHQLREGWTNQDGVRSEAFSELTRLGDWTTAIEVSMTLLMFLVAIWVIKKQRASIKALNYLNAAVVAAFIVLGYITSVIFDVPVGNAVQQLAGPAVITVGLLAYSCIAVFLNKRS
ncbi:hypothetical protein [Salisediminibacterium beveridgei]|uniref:Uncharacterized protein n=1 Tax=Salisediminibacterium beveridgei TaxID=632773 RepID=A0A1D7QXZ3_9BACI|nr:hypothetical protein [Salisediminibacterium beveridgei]AOM83875.1 hypothetical protein BBEV_2536 [Salisediminibacterium beveridgei]